MFNLLPQSEKKHAHSEYRMRMLIVLMLLLSAAVIASGLLLVPSYIISMVRIDAAEKAHAAFQATSATGEDPSAILASVKRDVSILASLSGIASVESVIASALVVRPLGVTIAVVNYEEATKGAGTLSLKGMARTRSDLVAYVRSLEATPLFAEVELPISNLARNVDIPFSMTIAVVRGATSTAQKKP